MIKIDTEIAGGHQKIAAIQQFLPSLLHEKGNITYIDLFAHLRMPRQTYILIQAYYTVWLSSLEIVY